MPQQPGKLASPFAQSLFSDVQPDPVVSHCLDDHVHVRVRLIRVKHHGVAMLRPELLPSEVLDGRQDLVRRCPGWHRGEHSKLPDEQSALKAFATAKSGQYIAPNVNWSKTPKEELNKLMQGPMAFILLRNPGKFSFPSALISYFIYTLVVTILIALYLPIFSLGAGIH